LIGIEGEQVGVVRTADALKMAEDGEVDLVEIAVGPVSNPVTQDCNIFYAIQRSTTAGTAALNATPAWMGVQEAGSDTPVPGSTWGAQLSAEPTITSNSRIWTKALNQHSGFIWYSPDEMGLPWPAVSSIGLTSDF